VSTTDIVFTRWRTAVSEVRVWISKNVRQQNGQAFDATSGDIAKIHVVPKLHLVTITFLMAYKDLSKHLSYR